MANFIWTQDYDVGKEILNDEHKLILSTMGIIQAGCESGINKNLLLTQLEHLILLANLHFRDEEAHMREISYPKSKHHARIHQDLIAQLRQHHTALGRWDGEFNDQFFQFLHFWMVEHILSIDKEYHSFEQEQRRQRNLGSSQGQT